MKLVFKVMDKMEHYPLPVEHANRFRGTGITLGCTHQDCCWRLERPLRAGDDIRELFALFHTR